MKSESHQHPGKILNKLFIQPLKIDAIEVARACNFTQGRISEIILGKRRITADTAIRLGIFFGNSAEFWLKLQMKYDIAKELEAKQEEYRKLKIFQKK